MSCWRAAGCIASSIGDSWSWQRWNRNEYGLGAYGKALYLNNASDNLVQGCTNPGQPLNLDYDDLYTTLAGELVWWDGLPDRHLNTLAEFQTATGQEPHGLSLAPGFANAASSNYTLDSTSHLIDAGTVIPGINDNFAGTAPDIGAFEYQSYGFTLSALPSMQAIVPGGIATFALGVQPIGGFTSTVTLVAASPSPSLTLRLNPITLTPPARAKGPLGAVTLTITDSHVGSLLLPGLWYTIPVTATGGSVAQSTTVGLLVGGTRVWLPVVLKGESM